MVSLMQNKNLGKLWKLVRDRGSLGCCRAMPKTDVNLTEQQQQRWQLIKADTQYDPNMWRRVQKRTKAGRRSGQTLAGPLEYTLEIDPPGTHRNHEHIQVVD